METINKNMVEAIKSLEDIMSRSCSNGEKALIDTTKALFRCSVEYAKLGEHVTKEVKEDLYRKLTALDIVYIEN